MLASVALRALAKQGGKEEWPRRGALSVVAVAVLQVGASPSRAAWYINGGWRSLPGSSTEAEELSSSAGGLQLQSELSKCLCSKHPSRKVSERRLWWLHLRGLCSDIYEEFTYYNCTSLNSIEMQYI